MLAIRMETTPTPTPGRTGALLDALQTERRLLDGLVDVMLRQRSGVASDDLSAIDDSVFAAQRMLRTLAEARRRRRALLALVTGREDVELAGLDEAMGVGMTPLLRESWNELQVAAQRLSHELERNRRILQGAITSGERLIRTLTHGTPTAPPVYAPTGGAAPAVKPSLLDRQV